MHKFLTVDDLIDKLQQVKQTLGGDTEIVITSVGWYKFTLTDDDVYEESLGDLVPLRNYDTDFDQSRKVLCISDGS